MRKGKYLKEFGHILGVLWGNALLNIAPGRRMPMTGVGVSFLPVGVFTQQLFKKAKSKQTTSKSKLSLETPTPVIGILRP